MTENIPEELLQILKSVKKKRAKTVIEHILAHGYVTTEELRDLYGYAHPPRAAGDVKDLGIPLISDEVTASDGRKIAAYKFGKLSDVKAGKLAGRVAFPKAFKKRLVKERGSRCAISNVELVPRYLQIDHRIPYGISGDIPSNERKIENYQLLSGSANREKSWSCEHCQNWLTTKSPGICQSCYWAYPENYSHVAMLPMRRIDIVWSDAEVAIYDRLKQRAEQEEKTLHQIIKEIIEKCQDLI